MDINHKNNFWREGPIQSSGERTFKITRFLREALICDPSMYAHTVNKFHQE